MMTRFRQFLTAVLLLMAFVMPQQLLAVPHDVTVTITRKHNPLPPNAGELKDNFGRYFNVTVTNTTDRIQTVRFKLNVQGPGVTESADFPQTDNFLIVHSTSSVPYCFILPAGQTLMLSEFELASHFKQFNKSVLQTSGELRGLESGTGTGGYGLLPEGHYAVQLQAISNDDSGSNVLGAGCAYFDIAYKASSPLFKRLGSTGIGSFDAVVHAEVTSSMMNLPYVRFGWTPCKLNVESVPANRQFYYDFEIYTIPKGGTIDNPGSVAFEQLSLVTPFCDVPVQEMQQLRNIDNGMGYAVRVRARSAFDDDCNYYYTVVDNEGLSNWLQIGFSKDGDLVDEENVDPGEDDGKEVESKVKMTLTAKQSELPYELETYFAQPSALFDVTIDNSEGEDCTGSMLMQYHNNVENKGFMPKRNKQHYDHTIDIKKGENRALTAEEIDHLIGGYDMSEIIEFQPTTGYLMGVTSQTTFVFSPVTASLRFCKPNGTKPISSCDILAKGRDEFTISNQEPDGDKVTVEITKKKEGAYPVDIASYMDKPEELFGIKVINNCNHKVNVVLQAVVEDNQLEWKYLGYDKDSRYIDRYKQSIINLAASGYHELTDEEVHKFLGGFPCNYQEAQECYYDNAETGELSGSYKFIVEAFDADASADELTFNDTYGVYTHDCKARMGSGEETFSTDAVGLELFWQEEDGERPADIEGYLDHPGETMQLAIDNNTGKEIVVFPVLTLYGPGDEPVYTIQGKMSELNERAKNKKLTIDDTDGKSLKDYSFSELMGVFDQVTVTGQNAGTYDIDVVKLVTGAHRVKVDLYDVSEYNGSTDVTSCKHLASDEISSDIKDLILKIKPKEEKLSVNASTYFGKPSAAWKVTVKNLRKSKRNIVLNTLLSDTAYCKWAAEGFFLNKEEFAKHLIELNASQEVELTDEQVDLLLGGYTSTYVHELKADRKGIDKSEKQATAGCYLPRGMAMVRLYGYDLDQAGDIPVTGENIAGVDSATFQIQSVKVTLTTKQTPMPITPKAYFGKPSNYLKLKLTNLTAEELKLYPRLTVQMADSVLSWCGDGYNKRWNDEHYLTLPAKGELEVTSEQLDALWGNFDYVEKTDVVKKGSKDTETKTVAMKDAILSVGQHNLVVDVWEKSSLPSNPDTFVESDTTKCRMSRAGTIKILVEPKEDYKDKMPNETLEYFKNPGEYFDVKLVNRGAEDQVIGMDFVYNDTLVASSIDVDKTVRRITVPGRGDKDVPDTLALSKEQVNTLVGKWALSDVRQLDTLKHTLSKIDDPQIGTGTKHLRAVAFSRDVNGDTLGIDSTKFFITLGEVKINDFVLHLSKSDRITSGVGEGGFKGEGWIGWSPLGFEIRMAVEFDSIWIDDSNVVTKGYVRTKKLEDDANFIPYDWFDEKALAGTGIKSEDYAKTIKQKAQSSDYGKYYNYINDGCKYISDIKNIISGDPVTLPLGIDNSEGSLLEKCPVMIQMVSCAWTPDSSWVNLLGSYKLDESAAIKASDSDGNNVLALAAPFLRIHYDDKVLLPESGMMALISDVTVKDQSNGFEMTFKAPSNFETLDDLREAEDGCLVTWTNSKFDSLLIDASVVIPELMKDDGAGNLVDEDGNTVDDEDDAVSPSIEFIANIGADGNWVARVQMDPFQIPDASGFTFIPTGTSAGILYDHSSTFTPSGVKFHKDYDFTNKEIAGKWSDANHNAWQGFYWEKLSLRFPDWLPTVGDDDKNISISMSNLMCDASGFTSTFSVDTLINAELDGWKISLDEINLSIVQSNFNDFGFKGMMGVPFMTGDINYWASVTRENVGGKGRDEKGTWKFQFQTWTDSLKMTFLPVVDLAFNDSHFDLTYAKWGDKSLHNNQADSLGVILLLNGTIGLKSNEVAGFELPDIHFYNMYVANHVKKFEAKYAEGAIVKLDGPTWHNGKGDESKATMAFSLGNWSLASMSKKLGPFEFELDTFGTDGSQITSDGVNAKLAIAGGISIMEGAAGVKAGFGIGFGLNWDTWKASYNGATFDSISVHTEFAGCTLDGSLGALDGDDTETESGKVQKSKGYEGHLKLALPANFLKLEMKGAFYKAKKVSAPYLHAKRPGMLSDSTYCDTTRFNAGYLEVTAGGAGIPLGAVKIKEVSGGFYINCSKSKDDELNLSPGMYGGMFGLRLSDSSGKMISGGMKLFVFWDSQANVSFDKTESGAISKVNYSGALSQIRLLGDVHVLTPSESSDEGMVNAKAMILYDHTPKLDAQGKEVKAENGDTKTEPYLEISITITASAGTDAAEAAIEKYQEQINCLTGGMSELNIDNIIAESTGINLDKQGALADNEEKKTESPKVDESLAESNNSSSASSGSDSSSSGDSKKSSVKCNGPSVEISMEFRVDFKDDGSRPWYLHLGTPTERCKYTYIDFSFGNSTVGAGALLGGNAYLCIGNTLPDTPELPSKVYEFLYGDQKDAGTTGSNSVTKDTGEDTRKATFAGFNTADSKGGIMLGAEVYGSFWCNALICYAKVEFDAGFDVSLANYSNKVCAETMRAPGSKGWYAQGQLYAYLAGEIGVMLKFLGKTHKWPIVELAVGGQLKMGIPNPTWFLGKFRAKGKILGGLISFNRSMTVRAGNVCTPLSSSPLDEIDIFADCTPGLETEKEAYTSDNAVSAFSQIRFTTNMTLDYPYELRDDNLAAKSEADCNREFRFKKVTFAVQKKSGNSWTNVGTQVTQADDVTYNMWSDVDGHFDYEQNYRILLIGRAYEKINGELQNPKFVSLVDSVYQCADGTSTYLRPRKVKMGESYQAPWFDTLIYYFRTGPKSYKPSDNFMVVYPNQEGAYVYENEARMPYVSLRDNIISYYNTNGKYVKVRVAKAKSLIDTNSSWVNDDDSFLTKLWKILIQAATQSYNSDWDLKNVESLYEYRVNEESTKDYVLWKPGQLVSGNASAELNPYGELRTLTDNTNFDDLTSEQLNDLLNGGSLAVSTKSPQPYVLQYVLVTPKQQNSARTEVDSLRTSSFTTSEANTQEQIDAIIASNNTDAVSRRSDRTFKGKRTSKPSSSVGYGSGYLPGRHVASSKSDQDAVDDVQATFLDELRQEMACQVDSYSVRNTLDDKNLSNQSEEVIWERTFYLYNNVTGKGSSAAGSLIADFNHDVNASSTANKKLTLAAVKPHASFVNGTSSNEIVNDGQPHPYSLAALEGIESGTDVHYLKKINDYEQLWNWSPTSIYEVDPFTFIAQMQKFGFMRTEMKDFTYIRDNIESRGNQVSSVNLTVSGWDSKKQLIFQSNGQTLYGEMAAATTVDELKRSYEVYDIISHWVPSTWQAVRATSETPTSGYQRAWSHKYTSDETQQMYVKTFGYLTSLVDATSHLASSVKYQMETIRDKGGFKFSDNDLYSWSGRTSKISTIADYVKKQDPTTAKSFSSTNLGITVELSYDYRQLPFLFARLYPIDGFLNSNNASDDIFFWYPKVWNSNWTQRILYNGVYYYSSLSQVASNTELTRRFVQKMKPVFYNFKTVTNTGKPWTDAWLGNRYIVVRFYRPNYWHRSNLYEGVMKISNYSNENTNVFIDKLSCGSLKVDASSSIGISVK